MLKISSRVLENNVLVIEFNQGNSSFYVDYLELDALRGNTYKANFDLLHYEIVVPALKALNMESLDSFHYTQLAATNVKKIVDLRNKKPDLVNDDYIIKTDNKNVASEWFSSPYSGLSIHYKELTKLDNLTVQTLYALLLPYIRKSKQLRLVREIAKLVNHDFVMFYSYEEIKKIAVSDALTAEFQNKIDSDNGLLIKALSSSTAMYAISAINYAQNEHYILRYNKYIDCIILAASTCALLGKRKEVLELIGNEL